MWDWDLSLPYNSYCFGLFLTDGHLYKNKIKNSGKLVIELSERDKDILEKIQSILPVYSSISKRTRKTNFKKSTSVILRVYDKKFRNILNNIGLPIGKKSAIIKLPQAKHSLVDLIRGAIDGDGSLGITSNNRPYISFNTSSDDFAKSYYEFIISIIGFPQNLKILKRNKRDNTYNICFFDEDAQKIVRKLYYPNCFAILRKMQKAQEVLDWKRPISRIKKSFLVKNWTNLEDQFILTHSLEESTQNLGRTIKSIQIRLWRLKNGKNRR